MPLNAAPYDITYFQGRQVPVANPAGYDEYSATTYYDESADLLSDRLVQKAISIGQDITGRKVLIIGCACGYLVQALVSRGVNAFGMDISSYAISQSPVPTRVIVGDCRLDADFVRARVLAGISPNPPNNHFDMIFDEDVLCCLTDAEAQTYITLARKYGNWPVHFLTIGTSVGLTTYYNYHTIAQWKNLLDKQSRDKWYARFTWSET